MAGGYGNVAGNDNGDVNDAEATTVGGGHSNTASGDLSTVGGGYNNTASGQYATVGGGDGNTSGDLSTVGGGYGNTASGDLSTVGGGASNASSGQHATVAAGQFNVASGLEATVGGGASNTASAADSTVGGGYGNTASGIDATVGGGYNNTAHGVSATIPGGNDNVALGLLSFAAGFRAKANQAGCFVWGDSTDADVACNTTNRWVARASGGVYFYTAAGLTTGVYVSAGGNSWNGVSDRATKDNFVPADGRAILEKLASLPIQQYNLKSQDPAIRHIGLVAQDFSTFGYGESDKAINMQDADGVAMAAIQGLYAENQALKAQVSDLEARMAALEKGQAPARTAGLPFGWLALGGVTVAAGVVVQRRLGGGRR